MEPKEIMDKLAEENHWPRGKWAHDGKRMLFTCGEFPLPSDSGAREFQVDLPQRGQMTQFTVGKSWVYSSQYTSSLSVL